MGEDKDEGDNDDWIDSPEAEELRRQMANLERKITKFKQEIETIDEEDDNQNGSKGWSKPIYITDSDLPKGWTYFRNREGSMFYRDAKGKFLKNRRNVLSEMYSAGSYTDKEIKYIRDGLVEEGWIYHDDLPDGWMFKQYTHKIEGVNTDVLYHLAPNGVIYRSKKKIIKCAKELKLSTKDVKKIQEFKAGETGPAVGRVLDEPDESWYFDSACVPTGWKMKRYTYNSGATNKTEEVYHYLTPDNLIVRGKKQVHDWMLRHGTYNSEDFGLFHFNKKKMKAFGSATGRTSIIPWSEWGQAEDLPPGWMVRTGSYKYQKKVQYKSPMDQIFLSRFKVLKFLKTGERDTSPTHSYKKMLALASKGEDGAVKTVWDDWRDDDIPCLPGWQFSIGRKDSQRKIRYKSPEGKVFQSRGPLIRYLHENGLKEKKQLITLKNLLKTNQFKPFEDLRTNDKFIKNFSPDWNYLLFLKIRYDNQEDIPEFTDRKLPHGWKKKLINGVEYFKDPSEKFVFNSRKLVVDHLRRTNFDLSDDQLVTIMEESDSESDLSDTESEASDEEEETMSELRRKHQPDFYPAPSLNSVSRAQEPVFYPVPDSHIKTEVVDMVQESVYYPVSGSDELVERATLLLAE